MTTIITRLFSDAASAQTAVDRLTFRGMPKRDCTIIVAGENATSSMERAQVHESAIAAYSKHLTDGNAVLVVAATYKPLGAARLTRETLAKYETVDIAKIVEEHVAPWQPDHAPSVMKDHPLFFSIPGMIPPGPITANFGMKLLKPHKTKQPLISGKRRLSRMVWPMPLLSKSRKARSAKKGGGHMSRLFWPMPLLAKGSRRKSVSPGGGLVFARLFGVRTLSRG